MANEFVIKNGYFSQGNSNVTGSLQVTGSVGVTGSASITGSLTSIGTSTFSGSVLMTGSLNAIVSGAIDLTGFITASKIFITSSNGNQLTVIGSGSTIAQVYGSQGNLLTVNDTFSGSIFTVTDISGYPILDVTSDYYTGSVFLPMMQSQSQQHVVVYDSQSGLLTYTLADAVGGGISFPYTITSSAVVPIFNVSGSYYFEIGRDGSGERLFRMQYDEATGGGGVVVEMGGITAGDTILTVNQALQTIDINAPTASIQGLTNVAQTNVVTIDTVTGQLFYTASSAIGGGGPSTFNSTSSVIGDGALTTWDINHGFNTRNLHITVYESSSNGVTGNGETVYPDIRRINENTASIVFANPPTSLQYIVYVSQ
jgi:hypothetical protein